MLIVTSCPLELRGIANKVGKKENVYYVLNCESADGTPHALYCPDASALPDGLHKGDMVYVTFNVHTYKGNERLIVSSVSKASDNG